MIVLFGIVFLIVMVIAIVIVCLSVTSTVIVIVSAFVVVVAVAIVLVMIVQAKAMVSTIMQPLRLMLNWMLRLMLEVDINDDEEFNMALSANPCTVASCCLVCTEQLSACGLRPTALLSYRCRAVCVMDSLFCLFLCSNVSGCIHSA